MVELRARYRVSRKPGCEWLTRVEAGGRPALRERGHAPHACSHRIADAVAALLRDAREAPPTGDGPRCWTGCARDAPSPLGTSSSSA